MQREVGFFYYFLFSNYSLSVLYRQPFVFQVALFCPPRHLALTVSHLEEGTGKLWETHANTDAASSLHGTGATSRFTENVNIDHNYVYTIDTTRTHTLANTCVSLIWSFVTPIFFPGETTAPGIGPATYRYSGSEAFVSTTRLSWWYKRATGL